MTVGATDLAFFDLCLNARPSASAAGVRGHICDFVVEMIELEHDNVELAAVDTGMGAEIFDDAPTILSLGGGHIPH